MKQVVFNSCGYAKPGELVAIMGPSGSGKTTLLSAIAHRTHDYRGAKVDGQIRVNGVDAEKGQFGNYGAFVQ